MAGTMNAGRLVYEVDMDTRRLLDARREIDAALNGLGGTVGRLDVSINRAERSVSSLQRTMSGLSAVARSVIAAISVQQVAAYGNEWVTVNNKLANSVRANEQLAEVTQRVFDISQNTMSSLTATATLYGRLERATRSAGTSTKDLITLTSTINKGLAVSGATTEEASSTMTQLSQALASGVLRGEEFNSISENGSRLAVALADSLGVTIGQLRAMAAQGKLTTEVVVNGLLQQSGAIAKEFANTTVTMGQAFTIATNNITKFVGESSSVSTSIRVFNEGVISLSQNLDVVANAIAAAAVIFGGRFAGALALATKARIDDMLAAKAQAKATAETAAATANAARVTALKAGLDKEQALSNLALAQTEYNGRSICSRQPHSKEIYRYSDVRHSRGNSNYGGSGDTHSYCGGSSSNNNNWRARQKRFGADWRACWRGGYCGSWPVLFLPESPAGTSGKHRIRQHTGYRHFQDERNEPGTAKR